MRQHDDMIGRITWAMPLKLMVDHESIMDYYSQPKGPSRHWFVRAGEKKERGPRFPFLTRFPSSGALETIGRFIGAIVDASRPFASSILEADGRR